MKVEDFKVRCTGRLKIVNMKTDLGYWILDSGVGAIIPSDYFKFAFNSDGSGGDAMGGDYSYEPVNVDLTMHFEASEPGFAAQAPNGVEFANTENCTPPSTSIPSS